MKTRTPQTIRNTYGAWKRISKESEPILVAYAGEDLAVVIPISLLVGHERAVITDPACAERLSAPFYPRAKRRQK